MEKKKRQRRKAVVLSKDCVACGCCERVCPKSAIQVRGGVMAVVDEDRCIGCSLCQKACPASIIHMEARDEE